MKNNSQIISLMLDTLYPFILLFGFYIILNGHNTPGGGFQGGAILSAIFIGKYLSTPNYKLDLNIFKMIEKILFILIIVIVTFFLLWRFNFLFPNLNKYYLILMNFLIGIKVCCGLSIVFFRFVFYESR